jgi:hypothetical protein
MARPHAAVGLDHGDARLVQAAAHGAGVVAGAFEAHLVVRLGVADVERAGRRVDQHVEQHRADVRERGGLHRGHGAGVEGEDVEVR